jgi:hypothetical protein
MSLDIHNQLFKMNSDFWPQARGPPSNTPTGPNAFQQSIMDATGGDFQSRAFNNNNNETNSVEMKEHLMQQQQQQSSDQNQIPNNNNNNNSYQQSNAFAMQNQQQNQPPPPPASSPGAENSSPEAKFNTEKLVNEIQVSHPCHHYRDHFVGSIRRRVTSVRERHPHRLPSYGWHVSSRRSLANFSALAL